MYKNHIRIVTIEMMGSREAQTRGFEVQDTRNLCAGKLSTEEFCTGNYHHHHHHCHHHKSLSSSSSLALPLSPSSMAKQTPVSWITPTHVTYIRGSRCSFQSFQPGDGDILMGIIIIVTIITIIIYLVIAILHICGSPSVLFNIFDENKGDGNIRWDFVIWWVKWV